MIPDRSPVVGETARFLLVGLGNTATTGVLFYLLTHVMPRVAAYVISYAAGIVIAGLLVPRFVFRRPASLRTSRHVGAGYLLVLLAGAALVAALGRTAMSRLLVVVLTLCFTVPANFVVARWIAFRTGADRR